MGASAPNQTMAYNRAFGTGLGDVGIGGSLTGSGYTTIASNTSGRSSDYYDAVQYYEEMRRAKEEALRMQAMQAYNPYTDTIGGVTAQQMQEAQKPIKAAQPEYLTNQKLLLLGEAS